MKRKIYLSGLWLLYGLLFNLCSIPTVLAANTAPTISGTPPISVTIGTAYSFTPTAKDIDNDPLTFAITNKPTWATFDTKTGKLSGTPTAINTTSGVVLSVTDGKSTAVKLPAFNIAVTPVNLAKQYGVASQSTTNSSYAASYAIDGNATTFNHTNSSTGGDWWQVKLPSIVTISSVVIKNRDSTANYGRLNGATVYITSSPYSGTLNEADKVGTLSGIATNTINLTATRQGSYVIVKAGTSYLHMAEVEVYGTTSATPSFEQAAYSFDINYKTPAGTVIGTTKAYDYQADPLTYSLDTTTTLPFTIDNQGTLKLNGALKQERYNFNVKVSDGKNTSTVPVTITAPINLAREFGQATQGGTYGSSGANLAIDGDATTYNHTSCDANNWWQVSLPNPTQISKILIKNRPTWQSRLNGATVYVTAAAYTGTLNAADKVGTLTGASTDQVINFATPKTGAYLIVKGAGTECLHMAEVEVYGQAPVAPAFAQSAYNFNLSERATSGATVGIVKAVDYQLSPITYSLEGSVPFAINAQGVITLTGALNYNRVFSYSFKVSASDGQNKVSVPVTISLGKGKGVWLQRWENISGSSVSDLLQATHYKNDAPDYTAVLTSFDNANSGKDNFGQKLSGIVVPAQSGNYQFAVIGDDATQLKLSSTVLPSDAVLIAEKTSWGNYQDWNAAAKSKLVSLEAGKGYYLEVLHKESGGGDHVSVAWKREGDANFTLLPTTTLYQDAMSAGFVKPVFKALQSNYLIPWTTAVGTLVATAPALDPQGDKLTYSIVGSVPFTVDAQGNVRTSKALQAGTTYSFSVSVTDGVYTIPTPLKVVTTANTAVADALKTGSVANITTAELLDATAAEVVTKKQTPSLLSALYGTDAIAYTPGNRTQLLEIKPWVETVFPILMGNKGNVLGLAGTVGTARYAAFGMSPTELFQAGSSKGFETPFQRVLAWLLAGEPVNTSTLSTSRKIALSFASSDRSNIRDWLASKYANWVVTDCNDVAQLANCYASADLIITGWQGQDADAPAIRQALANALGVNKPVLYVHTWYEATNAVANAIADLLNFSLPYGGNYWANDAANWTNVTAMQASIWSLQGLGGIEKLLNHFKANDYNSLASIDTEFYPGVNKVRAVMTLLDESKVNLFASNGSRLYRLLALLGDSYRQAVRFPMDKDSTNANTFLKSLFADHAVYNYRLVNPVQADMGNFSRSNFSNVTPVTKTVKITSRQPFRAAGVYALPGQTFRVTRNDSSTTTTKVFINTLRSGSTHEMEAWGYSRPKFLQSSRIPLKSGETIVVTSPYGGPIEIDFSDNDQPVQLTFQQVGEHPFWDDVTDNADFAAKLAAGNYDWAEFVTPAFEIHSTVEKMRQSISDTRWGGTLEGFAAATMRYTYNYPHVLAGFKGPNIDVVPEIKNFADAKGFTIDNLDMVKHMNADQATCGYGCSGNPYDAYWSFEPIGHGDIHELGHGLESGRFRFSGWEYHASTNPYSYYTKSRYYQETKGEPDCQSLPFKAVFSTLQASVTQANPASYLQTNLWATSDWSQQVSMTIQMMMAAQQQGKLINGWHLLARLHILEREFNRARANATTWDSKKASLGFSSYSKNEADAISNNDWMLIAVSYVTGLDYRDFLSMWGIGYSTKAAAQVAGFGYAATPRQFYVSSATGYCKGEGFTGSRLAVDGKQVWPQ